MTRQEMENFAYTLQHGVSLDCRFHAVTLFDYVLSRNYKVLRHGYGMETPPCYFEHFRQKSRILY